MSFFRLIVSFSAPLSAVILMMFGSAFFITYLSLFLESAGYSTEKIGIIQSSFFLGMFVGAFQMERLIKRVGHIQALAVFGGLAASCTLIQGLTHIFAIWVVLRFLLGLSLAALYIVIESWMLHHSDTKTRGVILSLYMISLYGAQSASQQVLAFVNIESMTPFMISALFIALSVIPVSLSTSKITLPPQHASLRFYEIIKASPFGVAGCFISGLALSALYSFLPIFSETKHISSANLMSVTIAGGVFLQWPIGKLSDRFERRKTLLTMVALAFALSLFVYVYKQASIEETLILSFVIGGFLFILYPLSITQVCDNLDHSHFTKATALLLIAYGLGSVLGPIASSFFVNFLGAQALFLYFTVLLGLLGLIGIYMIIRRPSVPLKEQTDFLALPSVTPVAYEMDPRSDENDED